MSSPYHAKYFAHELTRIGGAGMDRLSRSLFDACVDLNPHQIDAALFALRSPLTKGVLLADEVGLGKTIEAGLVICQHWAERKRRVLVICPASLRKQWALELAEKFNLPARVVDTKAFREAQAAGNPSPFMDECVVICSMHYASQRSTDIRPVPWDLVVIDEAHKLRNAYRQSNRIGQAIRWAIDGRQKILLTATPLQNSLTELYGLASIIDDQIFGDLPSFRTQYCNTGGDLAELRDRLKPFCARTLRRQVLEYIQFTERRLITRPFKPTEDEQKLYEAISAFLQREESYAIPHQQKHLITLLVRKVLASSSQAVAGTLEIMRDRLARLREELEKNATVVERIIEDEELNDDLLDELLEDQEDAATEGDTVEGEPEAAPPKIDRKRLDAEIEELNRYILWARSIGVDTKTRALLKALEIGFGEMTRIGAAQKAVVFTESRRTQQHLKTFLEANGHAGKVVTFNGTNNEPETTQVYLRWAELNQASGRASGSRAVDVRTAIIEHFRDKGSILIATEAAAEGINLQFCSLIVNFDLPWNPQRIEQRIGRCHRYGQKHDVVVVNFLNERNEADQRVHELLEQKFSLFFERYYEGGDFMSRRYFSRETSSKAAPYAVPYDGSEVYLHWANKDQYYIKTAEYFTNFTFDLSKAAEVEAQKGTLFPNAQPASLRVHFRLAAATEGEHGNVKASESNKRCFRLNTDDRIGFENGELVCWFRYQADPDKTGQETTWQAKRNEQAVGGILNALAEHADPAAKTYLAALKTPAPTEKLKDRPILARYVNQYTARNTTDYFIHKDLRGFLNRELDFYIKNEVMRLDDIVSADAPKADSYEGV